MECTEAMVYIHMLQSPKQFHDGQRYVLCQTVRDVNVHVSSEKTDDGRWLARARIHLPAATRPCDHVLPSVSFMHAPTSGFRQQDTKDGRAEGVQ